MGDLSVWAENSKSDQAAFLRSSREVVCRIVPSHSKMGCSPIGFGSLATEGGGVVLRARRSVNRSGLE